MASALQELFTALVDRLGNGGEAWAGRVYPDRAPAQPTRPYIVYFVAGGGESNWIRSGDASFSLTIKCVADTMQESLNGAARIGALLNDQGEQDIGDNPVIAGPEWCITTITQERVIHLVEQFGQVEPVYHDGHVFDFVMFRRT